MRVVSKQVSVAVGSIHNTFLLHLPASAITVISEGQPEITGGVVSLGRETVTVLVIGVVEPPQPILLLSWYSTSKVVVSEIAREKVRCVPRGVLVVRCPAALS